MRRDLVPRGRGLAAAVACALLAGCGVPTSSAPESVPVVPYDLLSPSATAPSTTSPTPVQGPRTWFVLDDALVATAGPSTTGSDPRALAVVLLRRLGAGPTDQQRADGLSTAFGPGVELTLTDVRAGRATVDIRAGDLAPSPSRLPLAVGQLVLTLTSIEGIDDVVLTSAGAAIEAPLPGGALTDRPLRAEDYAGLRARTGPAGQGSSPRTATGPASPTP